jgi:hypothetical protein
MNLPAFHDSPLAHMTPGQRLVFFEGAKRRAVALRRQAISDAIDAVWRFVASHLHRPQRTRRFERAPFLRG